VGVGLGGRRGGREEDGKLSLVLPKGTHRRGKTREMSLRDSLFRAGYNFYFYFLEFYYNYAFMWRRMENRLSSSLKELTEEEKLERCHSEILSLGPAPILFFFLRNSIIIMPSRE
jgi:hypothetical protein